MGGNEQSPPAREVAQQRETWKEGDRNRPPHNLKMINQLNALSISKDN
jgi:hypothetical protein